MATPSPPAGASAVAEIAEALALPHTDPNWSLEALPLLLSAARRFRLTPEQLAALATACRRFDALQEAQREMDRAGEALARCLRSQL